MKLAFIVQRYGREILGGAETLARQIAERLSRRHEIEVFTTTARDYITWKNDYPSGEEKLRGVRIRRFPVQAERDLEEFNRFSEWIYHNPHKREDEIKWLEMQGPVVPELIETLRQEHHRFDLLVFFTYLYYPTVYGVQVAPEKSVLIPTAHDEPPLALDIYKEVFDLPSSLIFNTEAEEILVLERFGAYKKMRETIGIGMELLDMPDTSAFRRRHKLRGRYLLYAGRIDAGKGCDELLRYFRFYKEERADATNLQLVLIGKSSMKIPQVRDIRYLGFVSEEEKLAAMSGALAMVIPSRLESLSIVALEAFSVATPVIVNAGSRVLVDHCRSANAGLYYADYEEFEQILDLLLSEKQLARAMGRLGQRYIKDNFGWQKLLHQYELAFRASARAPRAAVGAAARAKREARQPPQVEPPPPTDREEEERLQPPEPPPESEPAPPEGPHRSEGEPSLEEQTPLATVPSVLVQEGLPPGAQEASPELVEGASAQGALAEEEKTGGIAPLPSGRSDMETTEREDRKVSAEIAPPPTLGDEPPAPGEAAPALLPVGETLPSEDKPPEEPTTKPTPRVSPTPGEEASQEPREAPAPEADEGIAETSRAEEGEEQPQGEPAPQGREEADHDREPS